MTVGIFVGDFAMSCIWHPRSWAKQKQKDTWAAIELEPLQNMTACNPVSTAKCVFSRLFFMR